MAAAEARVLEQIAPTNKNNFRNDGAQKNFKNLNSQYNTEYLEHPTKRVKPVKPTDSGKFAYDDTKPLDPHTLHRIAYTDHNQIPDARGVAPPDQIGFRFDGTEPAEENLKSDYEKNYITHPITRVEPVKPIDNGKFVYDDTKPLDPYTLHHIAYTEHEPKREVYKTPHKPTPLCLRPPTQQGDQITAYDDYYREKNVIPRKLLRPDPPDHRPTEGSQNNVRISMNKEKYRTFSESEIADAMRSLIRPVDNVIFTPEEPHVGTIEKSENPFSEIRPGLKIPKTAYPSMQTTQRQDYKEMPVKARSLFIPARLKHRKITFDGKSTFKDDFREYEKKFHRPPSFKPEEFYHPPDHSRPPNLSSYRLDFRQLSDKAIHPVESEMIKRPPLPDKGDFETNTEYKTSFFNKSSGRKKTQICRPRQFRRLNINSKFNAQSWHGLSFVEPPPDNLKTTKHYLQYHKDIEKPSHVTAYQRPDNLPFIRKGEIGDWKNHLSAQQASVIDEILKEKGERSGIDQLWKNYSATESTFRSAYKEFHGAKRDICRPKVRDRLQI